MSADTKIRWPDIIQSVAESPFQTGRLILDGEDKKDGGWSIKNDGTLITFTSDRRFRTPLDRDPTKSDPLDLKHMFTSIAVRFPRLGGIFTYTPPDIRASSLRPHEVYTLPTLSTLNDCMSDLLYGLPAAGIQLVQTNDMGLTPAPIYDRLILNNQFAISREQKTLMHDLKFHAIPAAGTEKVEKVPFDELVKDMPTLEEDYGRDIMWSYAARLGEAYDSFTQHHRYSGLSLPDYCLVELGKDYTNDLKPDDPMKLTLPKPVLAGARKIIAAYPRDRASVEARNAHYAEFERRLKDKTPWMPKPSK